MSPLYEVYTKYNFPRYDSRQGLGYSGIPGQKAPSIGTEYKMASIYPYTEPPAKVKDSEEAESDASHSAKKKLVAKTGGPTYVNDPFSKNWTDRGAFVNGATRLDLYERSEPITLKDLKHFNSLGGISQFMSMGNGAGIYKTKPGRRVGMNIGSGAQTYSAKKTSAKIAPSLVDFIKNYMGENE